MKKTSIQDFYPEAVSFSHIDIVSKTFLDSITIVYIRDQIKSLRTRIRRNIYKWKN